METVEDAFNSYIEQLTKEGRASTAESYTNAKASLLSFRPTLGLMDISAMLLKEYESWMLHRNRSRTTVGIYLRSLRTLVNIAIEQGCMRAEQYPFGRRKYQIPRGFNFKRALSEEEIESLYYYKAPAFSPEDKARDLWFFSYLANGMNFKDICRLRYSNVLSDTIVFQRSKTAQSRSGGPLVIVILTEDLTRIISKWAKPKEAVEGFIFPVLTANDGPLKERQLTKQFIKTTNKYLSRIAKELDIQTKLTTYTARHSFSTTLKNRGASIHYIKESLGHTTTQTTENYLKCFPDRVKENLLHN